MTQSISQLASWPYTEKGLPPVTTNEKHWLQFWDPYMFCKIANHWPGGCIKTRVRGISSHFHDGVPMRCMFEIFHKTIRPQETPSMDLISFRVINVTQNSIEKTIMWHTVVHVKSDVNIVTLTLNIKDTWTNTSKYSTRTKNIRVLNVRRNIRINET